MITFITAHDGTEPFVTIAFELCDSIENANAGDARVVEVAPNGGQILAEMYGGMYPIFSQAINDGPVVILDTDCIVQKPFDHLFEQDFVMGAIHRGKCRVSQGRQDFLGCFVAFNSKYPNLARELWLEWMSRIYPYSSDSQLVSNTMATTRHGQLDAKGWSKAWFAGQTAYNDMLYDAEDSGVSILRLDRKDYAARPGDLSAYVTHNKGGRKLQ